MNRSEPPEPTVPQNSEEIARRQFSMTDQKLFARLSGDFNPIHVDPVEARRLITGQCVVHGIHNLLWSLDAFTREKQTGLSNATVIFRKQLNLDTEVYLTWDREKGILTVRDGKDQITTIEITTSELPESTKTEVPSRTQEADYQAPRNIKMEDLHVGQVFRDLPTGRRALVPEAFPALTHYYGDEAVYELALLSSLVGMQVPGRNSLFSRVKLRFERGGAGRKLRVERVDDRFKLVSLFYSGNSITAEIDAFFRPPPIGIPTCAKLQSKVGELGNLDHVSALIIGGSRGLGAWTAKMVALAGANVTITYNRGKQDAELVRDDVIAAGGRCDVRKLDIVKDEIKSLNTGRCDQLYYFATPHIYPNKQKKFDDDLFAKFKIFYVEKFREIASHYVAHGVSRILYPSTKFIDEPRSEFREYIKAKSEGEAVCDEIENAGSAKVVRPRIERVLTDQTNSIFPIAATEPLEVVVPLIRDMSVR